MTKYKSKLITKHNFNLDQSKMVKSQQYSVFPTGHPCKYYPSPTVLDFSDRTRTGIFTVV